MRMVRRGVVFLGLVTVLCASTPALALEEAVSDLVLIRQQETIADDLLAGGNVVRIKGTVEGDVVASAFDVVEVDGTVRGDLLAVAPRVVIRGTVEGSVRALAGSIIVEGNVGKDVLLAGGRLTITGGVAGDVRGAVAFVDSGGGIGGDLILRSFRARVDGGVNGDLEGTIRRASLGEGAVVGGDVVVRGRVDRAAGAEVSGRMRTPDARGVPLRARAYALLAALITLSAWLVAAPTIEWLAPGWLERRLRGTVGQWLGWGTASVVGTAGLVLLLGWLAASSTSEAAVVLGVIAAFVALAGIVVLVAAALVGAVPASIRIGMHVGSPPSRLSAHVRGVVVVFGLSLLPWVGGVAATAFLCIAIGSPFGRRGDGRGVAPSAPPTVV